MRPEFNKLEVKGNSRKMRTWQLFRRTSGVLRQQTKPCTRDCIHITHCTYMDMYSLYNQCHIHKVEYKLYLVTNGNWPAYLNKTSVSDNSTDRHVYTDQSRNNNCFINSTIVDVTCIYGKGRTTQRLTQWCSIYTTMVIVKVIPQYMCR